MPLIESDHTTKHATEIADTAMHTLAAELGISQSEANFRLFVAAGGTMTPAAVTHAVNQIRCLTKGMP